MDRWTAVKIIPSNQTLILANERGSAGGASGAAVHAALRAAAADGVLNRVTIVASHPDDSVLYVQADYSPSPERTLPPAADQAPSNAPGSIGDLTVMSPGASPPYRAATAAPYHLSRGVRLYANTQSLPGRGTATTTIDLHA